CLSEHPGGHPLLVASRVRTIVGWPARSRYDTKACVDRTAMFSTYVHREARGKGVGTILRRHLINEAKRLDFHTIVNRVFAVNERSIALAKKFGFTEVGHKREIVY